MMAFFYDRLGESLPDMAQFDALRDHARSISLLLVLEYHPNNLKQVSRRLRDAGQLTVRRKAGYNQRKLHIRALRNHGEK